MICKYLQTSKLQKLWKEVLQKTEKASMAFIEFSNTEI